MKKTKNLQSEKNKKQLHLINYALLMHEQLMDDIITEAGKFKERYMNLGWEMSYILKDITYERDDQYITGF